MLRAWRSIALYLELVIDQDLDNLVYPRIGDIRERKYALFINPLLK